MYKIDEILTTISTKYLTYMNFDYTNFYYISAPSPCNTDDNCFLQLQNQTLMKVISCLHALHCCCPHQETIYIHRLYSGSAFSCLY